MAMTLTLSGSQDLGTVAASVLGRLAAAAGMPETETRGMVDALSRAVEAARGERGDDDAEVRVAFAWAEDRIDVEIGRPDEPAATRLSQRLSGPGPGCPSP
jgi:hypothetical protein